MFVFPRHVYLSSMFGTLLLGLPFIFLCFKHMLQYVAFCMKLV